MEKKSKSKTEEEIKIKLDPKIQELYARLEEEREEKRQLQEELDQLKQQQVKEQEIDSKKAIQRTRKKLALQEQLQEKKLQKEVIENKQARIDNLLSSLDDQKEIHAVDIKSLNELKSTLDSLFEGRDKHLELINKLTDQNQILLEENENLKFTRTAFAHDLRSLMSSILGTITLLDLGEPEVAAELLPSLEERSRVFMNLLDAINANEVVKEAFNINAVNELLNLQIEGSKKKIKTKITGHDIQLNADKAAIYNVIQNLINNSVKYSGVETENLVISIDLSQDENYTILKIADNGVGIPENKREKIFDLYDRAGIDDSRGKGIGLYMVRKMIENHEGTIEYDNEFKDGARFVINLPPV